MNNRIIFSAVLTIFSLLTWTAVAAQGHLSYELNISDRSTFDRLQRTYQRGPFEKIPHVLFLVDRASKKVFFADSKHFDFHESFAKSLGRGSESAAEFFRKNYVDPDRTLFVGTLSYHPEKQKYFFEFTEGDRLTEPLLKEAYADLKAAVFAPIYFKPNSMAQDQLRETVAEVPSLPATDFHQAKDLEVFRPGVATGLLKFVARDKRNEVWEKNAIVIFEEAPIQVSPLRGVITIEPSSPLSHVHMLARSWKIPDVRWKNPPYEGLVGQVVTLRVTEGGAVALRKATDQEIKSSTSVENKSVEVPVADLSFRKLSSLSDQRRSDSIRFGAKSANLGELTQLKKIRIPHGFSIPFAYYADFLSTSGGLSEAKGLLASSEFKNSAEVRRARLAELREKLQKAEMSPELRKAILEKYHGMFGDKGVFVRSSTNAEDLPNFNGAGLYTSVPNVKADDKLVEAVKTVWASLWNFEAFQAREAAGMDHFKVYAGVLIQLGVNADSAGVLITRNPFKKDDRESVFINAKKGIGIQVVDGKKVPEQILFNAKTGASLQLTRSEEKTFLTFDSAGGLKELPVSEGAGRVLTDGLVKKLVSAALAIRTHFKNVPQDIEWVVVGNDVWIVQSRPYME